MNELQIGLVALGGAAVLGVFGYNKWQERQHRKAAERVFQQPEEDVLLEKTPAFAAEPAWPAPGEAVERREPVLQPPPDEEEWPPLEPLDEAPAREQYEPEPPAAAPELAPPAPAIADDLPDFLAAAPVAASPEPLPVEAPLPAAAPRKEVADVALPATLLSSQADAIAILELVEPVPASQVLASQRDALRRLRKPVHWVGFNEDSNAWEYLGPETHASYRRLRVGLQLADRQGPVSNGDFSLFSSAMQQLADELMAVADMPSSQQALDLAQRLDRFCADVDMQIGVNLVSRGTPFPGTKIRALAEAAGMTLGSNGCYTRFDDDGRTLFSLQNFEASGFAAETLKAMSTHGLVFLLDVPRVPRGQQVYAQMLDIVKRFAEALNGALVDDNRQPLGESQLNHIRAEYVVKPQAAMEAQGIPAGGPLALRLFA